MSVEKSIDLTATGPSVEEAVAEAVHRASLTLRGVTGLRGRADRGHRRRGRHHLQGSPSPDICHQRTGTRVGALVRHRRREPAPGVFRLVLPLPFPGLDRVNAYLLHDDAGSFLVDCGMWDPHADDGGFAELRAAVEVTGHTLGDIKLLVITHAHIDHFGMAGRVVEATGCELWMHEGGGRSTRDVRRSRHPVRVRCGRCSRITESSSDEIDELTGFEDWRPFVHSCRARPAG